MKNNIERQYLNLCQRILDEGTWVDNKRTGKKCLTVINADLEYDVEGGEFPLLTTRKAFWKMAIAELIGYLRGYDSAAQFRAIGCNTWNANANENEAWLNNPARKGTDDMGRVYGVQGRRWIGSDGTVIDQLKSLVDNLSNSIDGRGEILTFYNPSEFHLGCLRPCMHTHQFSLLGDDLYLNSTSRGADVALGLGGANMVQAFVLLKLVAQITGKNPKKAYHKIVNAHLYEDHVDLMKDVQLKREPFKAPSLYINPEIKTLEDIETCVIADDFGVDGYDYHPAIKYPFSV